GSPARVTRFPNTTLFRSSITRYSARDALVRAITTGDEEALKDAGRLSAQAIQNLDAMAEVDASLARSINELTDALSAYIREGETDRKSTRLNSSHVKSSY